MTKSVKIIAENTKDILTKSYQIVNSKATNQKSRTWLEKFTLVRWKCEWSPIWKKQKSADKNEKKLKEIEYFNHSAGCMSLKYLGNVVDYKEQLSL